MSEITAEGWELYKFLPSFVLGFHGCDHEVGEAILRNDEQHLKKSQNDYDWLGKGIYFWESNPQRALEFAEERAQGGKNSKGHIEKPFVIGAVINLRRCLNLSDSSALHEVQEAYADMYFSLSAEEVLPRNSGKLKRLDCAVFEFLHRNREHLNLADYDSVRGTYQEGEPLFTGTELRHQDHTQICVRNTDCILGYFRPIRL
jgi:hypothetical protein